MTDLNTVALVARLTKDVEIRYSANGNAIASISIAVNKRVKSQDGTWNDKASFFECTYFGKGAEGVAPYLMKGQQVSINGTLEQNSWTDQSTGQKRSKVVIIVNSLGLLGSSKQGSNPPKQPQNNYNQQNVNRNDGYNRPQGNYQAPQNNQQGGYKPQVAPENFEDFDCPF